jgi:hypothetical protein
MDLHLTHSPTAPFYYPLFLFHQQRKLPRPEIKRVGSLPIGNGRLHIDFSLAVSGISSPGEVAFGEQCTNRHGEDGAVLLGRQETAVMALVL